MWNWCQGKHRCKIASFTGNFHVSCHKRQMPTRTSDAVVSACVADRTLPRLGTFATKADILGKDPQWTQPITREAFWISFHPDWEINNCPLNKPIMVHAQVLEYTWGSRTAILRCFADGLNQRFSFICYIARLTGQGLTARFICCEKTILGNDPKRIRHLPVPCGKG